MAKNRKQDKRPVDCIFEIVLRSEQSLANVSYEWMHYLNQRHDIYHHGHNSIDANINVKDHSDRRAGDGKRSSDVVNVY